jgi:predicted nucleotidyltransferase
MKKIILKKGFFPDDLTKDLLKAKTILANLGARKIILYGSLARGDYKPYSDIDICVEGISKENYFRAIAECLMKIDRRISVLDFDKIQGYFKERILSEGKILYEV